MQMTQIAGVIASMLAASPAESLPTGYNIIVAAGQSNMQGATAMLVGTDDQTQTNLFAWGTAKGLSRFHTIYAAADPLDAPPTGGLNTGNTSFATQFARQYAVATGRKTLLVFVPYANTDLVGTIKAWQYTATPANPPTYTGNGVTVSASNLYSNMIYEANLAVAAAIAADPGSAIVGLLWAQGENDANQTVSGAAYQQALADLIAGFRTQVTGASNAWCIINGMVPEAMYDEPLNYSGTYANFRRIARAQKRLTAALPGVVYNRGSWGYTNRAADLAASQLGAIHYRDRGAWLDMAPRAISALATARAKTTSAPIAAPSAPTIRAITATSGQSLRVQLDRDFSQGNSDLVIQTAPAGSGTWSTYYAGTAGVYDYAEMVIIGGLTAGTAYDVRIADRNAFGTSAWSNTATATTGSSAPGYTFEDDTVGSAPAGVTMMTGRLQVIAAGTSSQGTVYGQSLAVSGSSAGITWGGWLDKIPVSQDRTVAFRLTKDNASNSGQIKVTLRAQADSPAGMSQSDEPRGYGFIVNYTGASGVIEVATDASATTQLSSTFLGQSVDRWLRFSVVGTTLRFEHSSNSTNGVDGTWTTLSTQTDATYQSGGAHLSIRNSGAANQLYVDQIVWS